MAIRVMVQSMKRLYEKGEITKEQVADRVKTGKISKEDYETITGEKYD